MSSENSIIFLWFHFQDPIEIQTQNFSSINTWGKEGIICPFISPSSLSLEWMEVYSGFGISSIRFYSPVVEGWKGKCVRKKRMPLTEFQSSLWGSLFSMGFCHICAHISDQYQSSKWTSVQHWLLYRTYMKAPESILQDQPHCTAPWSGISGSGSHGPSPHRTWPWQSTSQPRGARPLHRVAYPLEWAVTWQWHNCFQSPSDPWKKDPSSLFSFIFGIPINECGLHECHLLSLPCHQFSIIAFPMLRYTHRVLQWVLSGQVTEQEQASFLSVTLSLYQWTRRALVPLGLKRWRKPTHCHICHRLYCYDYWFSQISQTPCTQADHVTNSGQWDMNGSDMCCQNDLENTRW